MAQDKTSPKGSRTQEAQLRETRLKAALKANLARRKAQIRGRDAGEAPDEPELPDDTAAPGLNAPDTPQQKD